MIIKQYTTFIESIKINENQRDNTSWEDGGIKLTLNDVIEYLDEIESPIVNIDIESVKPILIDAERDSNRVENADLQYPIIVSKKDGKYKAILDGNHRVAKSINNNIETIPARILDLDNAPEEYKSLFG